MKERNAGLEADTPPLPVLGKLVPSQSRAWPWIIFFVAFGIRMAWAMYSHFRRTSLNELEFPDEEQYWLIANNLVQGLGLRDEIGHRSGRMPIFPSYLSLFVHVPNGIMIAKIVHIVLGSGVAVATYALGKRFFGASIGVLAGLLLAFDPFYMFFSTQLLTEVPFGLLITIFYWMLVPWVQQPERRIPAREWLAATLVAIFMLYVRESTMGMLVLIAVFVVIVRRCDARVIRGAVLSFLMIAAALFPWALRNKTVTGSWIWLTTRGGITLYDGVGPQATGQSYLNDVKQMPAVIGLTEVEYDRYFKSESRRLMREEPKRMLRLVGAKLSIFWNPFPNAAYYNKPSTRLVASLWTIPTFTFATLGVIMLWRQGGVHRRIVVFLLLPAIYLTAIHVLFVASIRYRMGAMPMIYVLTAFAVLTIFNSRRAEVKRGPSQ